MNATGVRLHSVVEWLLAAGFIVGFIALASEMQRDVPAVRAVMPVNAEETLDAEPPAGIPPRAVSLPMLLLSNGKEIRVGDSGAAVTALLGPLAQIGAETVERQGARERILRPYSYAGDVFDIVLENSVLDNGAELRVTGIYLH